MNRILKESNVYIIYLILIFSFKFAIVDWEEYNFWKPIIDNSILLVFLFHMLLTSIKWSWFSKRLLYSLIFILLLNTYGTLFGMDVNLYCEWYYIPLLSLTYTITITSTIKIIYKLYILWKNGKIKLY